MKIPWARPYIGQIEKQEVEDSMNTGWVSMGPKVSALEQKLSSLLGVKHSVAVNSGTAALDIALKIFEVSRGDEIIVPAMTYIATVNAVTYNAATPVPVDIDPNSFNIDVNLIEQSITANTKGIAVIDYGGNPANYDRLKEICDEHNLFLLQDGAHSIGGFYKGKSLCSMGDICTVSFHAAKTITTVEGGAIFVQSEEHDYSSKVLRSQGEDFVGKYSHTMLGHNYRMSDLHAAVGLGQFSRYEDIMNDRKRLADQYNSRLAQLSDVIGFIETNNDGVNAWFLYSILVEKRDQVKDYMKERGVDTRVSWPLPVYDQPLYKGTMDHVACPVSEKFGHGVLNLPMYYGMSTEEIDFVVEVLKDAVGEIVDSKYELV